MKRGTIAALAALAGTAGWVLAQEGLPPAARPAAQAPETDARHHSYAIGLDLGLSFRADEIELDVESLMAGVRDGLQQAPPRYTAELCDAALAKLAAQRLEKFRARNLQFLQANRQAEGVQTLPSGLQYRVLAEGDGPSPGPQSKVRVHYRGQLIDGTVFDETFGGQPATLGVSQVIPGWSEALQKMRRGDRWVLFIPPALAYAEQGFGEVIPPHAALVFELHLLEVLP